MDVSNDLPSITLLNTFFCQQGCIKYIYIDIYRLDGHLASFCQLGSLVSDPLYTAAVVLSVLDYGDPDYSA